MGERLEPKTWYHKSPKRNIRNSSEFVLMTFWIWHQKHKKQRQKSTKENKSNFKASVQQIKKSIKWKVNLLLGKNAEKMGENVDHILDKRHIIKIPKKKPHKIHMKPNNGLVSWMGKGNNFFFFKKTYRWPIGI